MGLSKWGYRVAFAAMHPAMLFVAYAASLSAYRPTGDRRNQPQVKLVTVTGDNYHLVLDGLCGWLRATESLKV
ncbi:hypothetical protein ACFLWZ_02615 [Chloroflexota bacterium]